MYPTSNLQPGAKGAEVRKLQNYLVSQNLMSQADITGPGTDVYGPKTTAAVAALQQKMGIDTAGNPGYWGPRTVSALSGGNIGTTSSYNAKDGTMTKTELDTLNNAGITAIGENPIGAQYISKGNSAEALAYASSTGDVSGLVNEYGQPFTVEQQKEALNQATADTQDYYDAQKQKDTQDAESKLKQDQLDYQNYLATSKTKFEGDKATLDQNAANKGVLFSGGRAQKEKSLQSSYLQDQTYKQNLMGTSIGDTARDFQYKYGGNAANNLSSYYGLGSNQFNPNVAAGGVTSGGLTNVYSSGNSNFGAGTVAGEQSAINKKNAIAKLWNRGNKLLSTGYTNQK